MSQQFRTISISNMLYYNVAYDQEKILKCDVKRHIFQNVTSL